MVDDVIVCSDCEHAQTQEIGGTVPKDTCHGILEVVYFEMP